MPSHLIHRLLAWLLMLPLLLLSACGGGSDAPAPASITRQPASLTVATGADAQFSVQATGDGLAYQWSRSGDDGSTWQRIDGATEAQLTLPAVTRSESGLQLRVLVSAAAGNATSNVATLTVLDRPSLAGPPADATTRAGQPVTFSVQVVGGDAVQLQWQKSRDEGASWTDVAGATAATLTLPAPTAADDGLLLRVQATNAVETLTSASAHLSVTGPPVFTTPPQPASVALGQAASFTVVAAGQPAPALQWQRSDDGKTWTDIAGATAARYTTPPTTAADDGDRFRAVATNAEGSVASSAAVLSVVTAQAPVITRQPDDTSVAVGARPTFTAAASGVPAPTWQWQRSADGGKTWSDVDGATEASFTLPAVQATDSGARWRAVARNSAGQATTRAALLTVTVTGPASAAIDCAPWSLPDGTVVQLTFPSTTPGFGSTSTQTTRQGVSFDSRRASEVTIDLPLTATTTLQTRLYASVDSGGVLTLYGSDSVYTGTVGSSTTTQRTTLVYQPAVVRRQFALAPGGSEPVSQAPASSTVVLTVDGVAGAPETTTSTETLDGVRFVGYETVTVGAGTFGTCKYVYTDEKGAQRTEWVSRRYAVTVKTADGGATKLVVNGSVVTKD